MRKASVIVNGYVLLPSLEHFVKRMQEEFSLLGFILEKRTTFEVLSLIEKDGKIPSKYDLGEFVLFLDKDIYLSNLLEKQGYRLFNSANSIRLCDDKMLTYIELANNDIPMPKSLGSPLNYFNKPNEDYLKIVEEEFSYPLVGKTSFGSMGSGVRLIKNREELKEFDKEFLGKPTLYQEFISSSLGKDYRVIVIGGKAIAWMERHNENDFRSNLAIGGTSLKVELPPSFKEVAIKAATILGCDYAGVDLLLGENNEPLVCEVNSNAFISGIEKTSGVNVARAYAKYILSKLK